VLVSRSDVESSSARARSVAIIEGPNQPQTPVADPAFKAVLLTPRGSTGRPVQLDMGKIPKSLEPPAANEPPPSAPVATPAAAAPASSPIPPASSGATAPASSAPASAIATAPASASPPPGQKAVAPAVAKVAPEPSVKQHVALPPSTRSAPPLHAAAPAKSAPRPKSAEPQKSSYGATEIAASRAFTRF
jgi:hypothetical protein